METAVNDQLKQGDAAFAIKQENSKDEVLHVCSILIVSMFFKLYKIFQQKLIIQARKILIGLHSSRWNIHTKSGPKKSGLTKTTEVTSLIELLTTWPPSNIPHPSGELQQ